MAQGGAGADCGSDAGPPFLPLGRVVRIPFSDLEQERGRIASALQSFGKATETGVETLKQLLRHG
jgi:hypothetical protein